MKLVVFIIGTLIGYIVLNNKMIVKNNKPVWTFEKTTILSIKDIESILFEIAEGHYKSDSLPFILIGKSSCTISSDSEKFIISFEDEHKEYISIDPTNHTLTTQGEWWYRGIYSLHPQAGRTLIKLDVYNVAQKHRWAASFMILPERKKHKEKFEKFVTDLESGYATRQKKGIR